MTVYRAFKCLQFNVPLQSESKSSLNRSSSLESYSKKNWLYECHCYIFVLFLLEEEILTLALIQYSIAILEQLQVSPLPCAT